MRLVCSKIDKSKTKVFAIDINPKVKEHIPKKVQFFCGDSHEIGKAWTIPLDFVFIDADHSYAAVLEDFHLFAKWVKVNGLILLHDTYPPSLEMTKTAWCGDAWKAAWDIRKKYSDEYEIVTLPITYGLSIIRKSKYQIKFQEQIDDENN